MQKRKGGQRLQPSRVGFHSGRMARFSLAAIALSAVAAAGDGVYQEEEGLLVIEIESAEPVGEWAEETSVSGYTGESYFRWTGPNKFTSPGHSVFGFDFEIHEPGKYWFAIRNHHDHPDQTEANDVWVRMDGGTWIKTFSSIKDQWTWHTRHELDHDTKPPASYQLSAGEHRIEFSGRSNDFRMDRFHLYIDGHPDGTNPSSPESDYAGANSAPVAKFKVVPDEIPYGDSHSTVIRLDARNSYDPDGDQIAFRWFVRGAEYVGGTTDRSEVARITLPGGRAWPVQLTVTELTDEGLKHRTHEVINVAGSAGQVSGALVAWHPFEIAFEGPTCEEEGEDPNPFTDFRLVVELEGPGGQTYLVPGFYDGDGQGGGDGNVWKARFAADAGGVWSYRASFHAGPDVAVDTNLESGTPTAFHGASGFLIVYPCDEEAPGFLSKGVLEHVGEHYLKFREGEFFIKGGTDSPENFFGYMGFDDIHDNGNLGIIHEYQPHRADWNEGDPYFVSSSTGVDSKGIIGALNYLSERGVNSIYFLPMNLGGDGQETTPFGYGNNDFDKTHYDVSRLHQWNQVFEHAQRKGVMLHFVLNETEFDNEHWLDDGQLGLQRKLFYRELSARFGHNLAIKWNLSEENDFSVGHLIDFAEYIDFVDPYDHPITVHTKPNSFHDYEALKGNSLFSATSIQYDPDQAQDFVEQWRRASELAGHKWVIDMDENNPWYQGLTDQNADDLRKRVLYDVYFSGGHVEWYAGYHDLPLGGDMKLEDFRTREEMWDYMRYAREFMEDNLPFWEMEPMDQLLQEESEGVWNGGQVFAKRGEIYAIYLPKAQKTGKLNLGGETGRFRARWWNPRTGAFEGSPFLLVGGGQRNLGSPPADPAEDWVLLVQRPAGSVQ